MSDNKVECQCCGKKMVPKIVYGYRFFSLATSADHSVCPFCLSPYWMVTADSAQSQFKIAKRVILKTWLFGLSLFLSVVAVVAAGWMSVLPVAVIWFVVLANKKKLFPRA